MVKIPKPSLFLISRNQLKVILSKIISYLHVFLLAVVLFPIIIW